MKRFAAIAFLIAALGWSPAQAQSSPPSGDVEFAYARPGQPTITVNVLGQVAQPGRWRIEEDVDLVNFLTVLRPVGVGLSAADTRQQQLVRVYRPAGDGRALVFESGIPELLSGSRRAVELVDGDTVVVETMSRSRFNLQTGVSLVGALASVVLLVLQVSDR
jgi:hypothetical protein